MDLPVDFFLRVPLCRSYRIQELFLMFLVPVLPTDNGRGKFPAGGNLPLGQLSHLKREGNILVDGPVRIKGIALEDHGNIPVTGRDIVDFLSVDTERSGGNILKSGYPTQGCGLSASGRTDKDNEFLILDFQVQIRDDRLFGSGIDFNNVFKFNTGHKRLLLSI